MLEFEWDDAKALANRRAHGVAFYEAVKAFRDPFDSARRAEKHEQDHYYCENSF